MSEMIFKCFQCHVRIYTMYDYAGNFFPFIGLISSSVSSPHNFHNVYILVQRGGKLLLLFLPPAPPSLLLLSFQSSCVTSILLPANTFHVFVPASQESEKTHQRTNEHFVVFFLSKRTNKIKNRYTVADIHTQKMMPQLFIFGSD